MRFPFGRGARQREIDGLRQRIAELQDEIAGIEQTLTADTPDVETSDAYRSVQLLRESMRREELGTLRQELSGLEARLDTLTADRRPPTPAVAPAAALEKTSSVDAARDAAGAVTEAPPEPTPTDGALRDEPYVAPEPVTGHGLPSERAIIEPTLPRPAAATEPEALPGEAAAELQPAPTASASEVDVTAESRETPAATEQQEPAQAAAIVDEAAVEATLAGATALEELAADIPEDMPSPVADAPTEAPLRAEPVAVGLGVTGEAAMEEPAALAGTAVSTGAASMAVPAADLEATQPVAVDLVPDAPAGAPVDVALTTPEAPVETSPAITEPIGEPAPSTAGVPLKKGSGGRIALILVVLLAFVAIAAVGAFESGLIAPAFLVAPTVTPTARPTLAPTIAPTQPPPTPAPTAPPQPTAAALGGAPGASVFPIDGADVGLVLVLNGDGVPLAGV